MLPDLSHDSALFLDFDGTLAPIVAHPAYARLPDDTRRLVALLHRALGGALAIVSGRPIEEIDRLVHPLRVPVAGVHGLERRSAAGRLVRQASPDLGPIVEAARRFAAEHEGVIVEAKPGSVALHYRQAPHQAGRSRSLLRDALQRRDDLALIDGKMVVEAKSSAAHKGHAVAAFLAEAPFAGRAPVFVGDDVTDEAAMLEVQSRGGSAIKVGPGPTIATGRLADPAAVRAWLAGQVAGLESPESLT